MKTVKVSQTRWGLLALVLTAAVAIGVAASLMCGVGAPMLAARLAGVPHAAIDVAVSLIDLLGFGAMFIPAVGVVASIGIRVVVTVIKQRGVQYAARW